MICSRFLLYLWLCVSLSSSHLTFLFPMCHPRSSLFNTYSLSVFTILIWYKIDFLVLVFSSSSSLLMYISPLVPILTLTSPASVSSILSPFHLFFYLPFHLSNTFSAICCPYPDIIFVNFYLIVYNSILFHFSLLFNCFSCCIISVMIQYIALPMLFFF